jgi:hypothetical protein
VTISRDIGAYPRLDVEVTRLRAARTAPDALIPRFEALISSDEAWIRTHDATVIALGAVDRCFAV